jgi:hypothetical protein
MALLDILMQNVIYKKFKNKWGSFKNSLYVSKFYLWRFGLGLSLEQWWLSVSLSCIIRAGCSLPFLIPNWVTLYTLLEIGCTGNCYTVEIGKCYKVEIFFSLVNWVRYFPIHHLIETMDPIQPPTPVVNLIF